MLYLGCHLSSSKGYATMGKTALSIGANTFQFFTRNPRGGAAKAPTRRTPPRSYRCSGTGGWARSWRMRRIR